MLQIHVIFTRFSGIQYKSNNKLQKGFWRTQKEQTKNKKNKESAVKELLSILPKADQSCQIHIINKLTISKANFYKEYKRSYDN